MIHSIYQGQVSLVSPGVRCIPIQYSASRCHPILRSGVLWRNLLGPRFGILSKAILIDRRLQRCHRRLDSLRSYSAWLRGTTPVGISNDSMGSSPNHPFYRRVIEKLGKYARNWRLPYLTVMLSTGPLFLSIMWKEYLMSSPPEHLRVAILPEQWYVEEVGSNSFCKVQHRENDNILFIWRKLVARSRCKFYLVGTCFHSASLSS